LHSKWGRLKGANVALFLASDEVNFLIGVTLPVDGSAVVRRG
jgi:hypothetical protein